jgi:hypothetical protein
MTTLTTTNTLQCYALEVNSAELSKVATETFFIDNLRKDRRELVVRIDIFGCNFCRINQQSINQFAKSLSLWLSPHFSFLPCGGGHRDIQ